MIRLPMKTRCTVSEAKDALALSIYREAALCGNCRIDLAGIESLLASIIDGRSGEDAIEVLADLAENLLSRPHCPSLPEILEPLVSSLKFSRAEFDAHALARHCPAGSCERLIPAPCQNACPAGIDIPGYLALTARGRYGEALDLIRRDNPFPWVCGLICPHPCENVCVRANLDDPLNIRYLKAFVAERALKESRFEFQRTPAGNNGIKVAVVGSGPAGLSCGFFLAVSGYSVTIFEALSKPGGLLAHGIPRVSTSALRGGKGNRYDQIAGRHDRNRGERRQ